jgi:hypothetical protein
MCLISRLSGRPIAYPSIQLSDWFLRENLVFHMLDDSIDVPLSGSPFFSDPSREIQMHDQYVSLLARASLS